MPHAAEQAESLEDQARSMHEEARMVLPGIQALFGFQLIAVFNRPFFDLTVPGRALHLASLILVGVAVGLIMAPAAHHRLTEPRKISSDWIKLASRYIARAMAVLIVAISIDIYIVAVMIFGDHVLAAVLGAAIGSLLGWLWFAVPLLHRRHARSSR